MYINLAEWLLKLSFPNNHTLLESVVGVVRDLSVLSDVTCLFSSYINSCGSHTHLYIDPSPQECCHHQYQEYIQQSNSKQQA